MRCRARLDDVFHGLQTISHKSLHKSNPVVSHRAGGLTEPSNVKAVTCVSSFQTNPTGVATVPGLAPTLLCFGTSSSSYIQSEPPSSLLLCC